jgi:hypothetical protein
MAIIPILAAVAFAPTVGAQTPATLPAPFYDVEVHEQLGFADSEPRRGFGTGGGPFGPSRFIISADSLLYRRGSQYAEISISAFVSVDEIRRPAANQNSWVKITYLVGDDERQLFVRRTGTRGQGQLLATLRLAMERNAAAREFGVR